MEKNIVVIEGDGIGPEVTRQAVKVLTAIAENFSNDEWTQPRKPSASTGYHSGSAMVIVSPL